MVAACTTLGHATPQLAAQIEGALAVGASREEIIGSILQTLFYAGGAAVAFDRSVSIARRRWIGKSLFTHF